MILRRAYFKLTKLLGWGLAQVACTLFVWTLIALIWRFYIWLDGSVAGGIDPVRFSILAILALIVFQIWRFFAEVDLEG